MNTPPKPARPMSLLTAACGLLFMVLPGASYAQQYAPRPKPPLGTRIVNFMKDLIDGDEPDNRYRGYAPPPVRGGQQVPPQRRSPQGGQRYNLDRPPPAAEYPEDRLPPQPRQTYRPEPPAERQAPSQDMPYSAPREREEPAPKPRNELPEDVEPPSPDKEKPATQSKYSEPPPSPVLKSKKTTEPKPEVQETLPPSKPDITPERRTEPSPQISSTTPKEIVPDPPRETKQPSTSAPSGSDNALTGTKTGKSGLVKSPYAPYNELDVTGLPSGSLAMDPTTGKVFRVP